MPTEEQRMLAGKLYNVYGKDLAKKYAKKDHLLHQINFAEEGTDVQKRFKQLLGQSQQRLLRAAIFLRLWQKYSRWR